MAKKKDFNPFILLTLIPDPSPTSVTGNGSGQSTTDPYACSFTDWSIMFPQDYNGNGVDFDDYHHWFIIKWYDDDVEELQALWEQCGNTGNVFPDPLNP